MEKGEETPKRQRRTPAQIQEDIEAQEAKLSRYKERMEKLEKHIEHLKELKSNREAAIELAKNGVDLKIASVVQTEGGFREYEVTTDEGLKFLSIRKLKEGSTYRVSKNFYETMQNLASQPA